MIRSRRSAKDFHLTTHSYNQSTVSREDKFPDLLRRFGWFGIRFKLGFLSHGGSSLLEDASTPALKPAEKREFGG